MPGPMRVLVRRVLLWGIGASVILPMVMAVVVGLGTLLHSLGDPAGGLACGRFALVAAVGWLVAVICTSLGAGLVALEKDARPCRRRRYGRRGRRANKRRRRGTARHGDWSDQERRPPPPPSAGPG